MQNEGQDSVLIHSRFNSAGRLLCLKQLVRPIARFFGMGLTILLGWRAMYSCVQFVAGFLLTSAAFVSGALANAAYEKFVADNGLRYLVVSGEFSSNDQVETFVDAAKTHQASVVTFNSPGGNVYFAMRLGRSIRSMGLNTIQVRASECASACALAFLGGVGRYAEPGSVGVHQNSFSADVLINRDDAVAATQMVTADVLDYLTEMGVRSDLLKVALRYSRNDIRYLSGSEMTDLKVTTVAGEGTSMAALNPNPGTDIVPALPQQPSPPPNTLDAGDNDAVKGLDPANARRAIRNGVARYRDAGISGLEVSSNACWETAKQKRQLESVQYCRILDMVGTTLSQSSGFARSRHFDREGRINALVDAMWFVGITDPKLALRIATHWQGQFDQEFASTALASSTKKPEVKARRAQSQRPSLPFDRFWTR